MKTTLIIFSGLPGTGKSALAQLQEQRNCFYPWKPNSALFVDGLAPVETNLNQVLTFIAASEVELAPL